jgi:transposase
LAWWRNHRYGTIICDLERRKTIALLLDREPMTAQTWLSGQPQIASSPAIAAAATPWRSRKHFPTPPKSPTAGKDASHAFLDAVHKSMQQIRAAIGAAKINPKLLTAAEKLQYEGYLRREETNAVILGLSKDGVTIKEIVRRTGHSRGLTRTVLRGQLSDVFRSRQSSLDAYLPWLEAQWAAGRRNGAELWRSLKQQGFRGSLRAVAEWTARRRQADPQHYPWTIGFSPNYRSEARNYARLGTSSGQNQTRRLPCSIKRSRSTIIRSGCAKALASIMPR